MKDVFDIGCARLCATVVIAAVAPLASSCAHSTNTLQYAAPLRVALRDAEAKGVTIERDPRDPALWDEAQIGAWLAATALGDGDGWRGEDDDALRGVIAEAGAARGDGDDAAAARDTDDLIMGAAGAAPAAAGGGGAAAGGGGGGGVDGGGVALDAALFKGLDGMQVCLLTEPEFYRRVQRAVPGGAGARLAKRLHAALWALIVDAKTRKRKPNGALITDAQEAAAQAESDRRQAEKLALWKEREKTLQSELSYDDKGESTG